MVLHICHPSETTGSSIRKDEPAKGEAAVQRRLEQDNTSYVEVDMDKLPDWIILNILILFWLNSKGFHFSGLKIIKVLNMHTILFLHTALFCFVNSLKTHVIYSLLFLVGCKLHFVVLLCMTIKLNLTLFVTTQSLTLDLAVQLHQLLISNQVCLIRKNICFLFYKYVFFLKT